VSDRQIIDVERLVEELKERVAREQAAGAYADDLSGVELEVLPPLGDGLAEGFDLQPGQPRVRFRPELGFSSKPVIGPVITGIKKVILRLIFFVMDDLARQTDAAVTRLEAALAAEAATRERADAHSRDAQAAEAAVREGVQSDMQSVSQRLAALDNRLERLQLESRLARLERGRRTAAPAPVVAGESPQAAAPAFDYERFEARFRPETAVREHQQAYVELLRDKKRVVDLGCGRGELIEMLGEQGVSAYGVEIDPDFISRLEDKGIEVVAQDAVSHLAELEPGAVDGIVASHVVEHLPPAALVSLVSLAAEKIAEGGILILETPNPESLVAGSVNFHRDLTHVRPIHPDTLSFLCESAGFSQVEIRRLSPVPDDGLLPKTGDEKIDEAVDQLNGLLYGFQDYAVVATA
jgi:2-polyprenyl-3-methyl-5-hydroxy-6-metoxy-1,4-benzoquinol methylase